MIGEGGPAEGLGFDGSEIVPLLILIELIFFFMDDFPAEDDVIRNGAGGGSGELEEMIGLGRVSFRALWSEARIVFFRWEIAERESIRFFFFFLE